MCSFAVQIVYGILGVAVLGLTITSLVLDSWTKVSETVDTGLWCSKEALDKAIATGTLPEGGCNFDFEKFTNLTPPQKVILICIILAIVAEVCCLVYNFFTACACCCKTILLPMLTFLSLIVAVLLGVVVGVYYKGNPDLMNQLAKFAHKVDDGASMDKLLALGNSFICAACAFAGAVINTIVSFIAIFCAATLV